MPQQFRVSHDIVEPNEEWKAYKRQVTGAEWGFHFRIIYLNYCPDIEKDDFEPSRGVCERKAACGWTSNYSVIKPSIANLVQQPRLTDAVTAIPPTFREKPKEKCSNFPFRQEF